MENTLSSLLNELKGGFLGHSTSQSSFMFTSSSQLSPTLPSCVEDTSIGRPRPTRYEATTDSTSPPNASSPTGRAQLSTPLIRSWEAAVELAHTFLLYCNAQPLPLFHPDNFVTTFPNRPFEVVYGVLAMAFRFTDKACEVPWNGSLPGARECRQAAHQLAMSDVSTALIELSTIQTLCLLALIDLNGRSPTQRLSPSGFLSMMLNLLANRWRYCPMSCTWGSGSDACPIGSAGPRSPWGPLYEPADG